MAQQNTSAAGSGTARAGSTKTIALNDLKLVLASARLRRYTNGRTALLSVITPHPLVETDCSNANRRSMRECAQRTGLARSQLSLINRGHIANLYTRVRLDHGLGEVRKTWGTGLRALQAEPRHWLKGGAA